MKTLLTTALSLLMVINVMSQPNFEEAIGETLEQLHKAEGIEQILSATARFERIAGVESSRWEAPYHLAYSRILLSFSETDGKRKDEILDLADKDIEKALALGGDKSELLTLKGFSYQGRIQVNPMRRGQKYSGMAAEVLTEAIDLNPSNPRAHFLMGQNVYHTPAMFGGGCKNAVEHFKRAVNIYASVTPCNDAKPQWGYEPAASLAQQCGAE
jgi:hypothetical protein